MTFLFRWRDENVTNSSRQGPTLRRMAFDTSDVIKEQVRTHYAASIGVRAAGCCATPSYGCGNPFSVASLQPGDVVLDLGCGAGLDALVAARAVGNQGRVYGLDMTDEMLAVAEE